MTVLIIGPHPDDELLGAGGALLRWLAEGVPIAWCLVTALQGSPEDMDRQRSQVDRVRNALGIPPNLHSWLKYPTAALDRIGTQELVESIHAVIEKVKPTVLLVPHSGDVHSDHRIVAEAAVSASKWFRQPSIRQVLAYETLSETEQGTDWRTSFVPNVYVDISPWLRRKIEVLSIYEQELDVFPFPRSQTAVECLARVRGAAAGFDAAEAFMLLRSRSSVDSPVIP